MSREQMIHDAAMEIMREVGVKIHNEKAVEILKQNGIKVEGNIAYFTEEQVMRWVKMAPESFTIYARNPKYNVYMGGDQGKPGGHLRLRVHRRSGRNQTQGNYGRTM